MDRADVSRLLILRAPDPGGTRTTQLRKADRLLAEQHFQKSAQKPEPVLREPAARLAKEVRLGLTTALRGRRERIARLERQEKKTAR